MLGSLARWLRFAGFDCHYETECRDAALAALARVEGRWLLTRDRELASVAGPRVVLLQGQGVGALVAELGARIDLHADPSRFFTRCPRCNGDLEDTPREAVVTTVPPYVAAHAERFRRCTHCGRVYWPGTHVGRISRRLAELFPFAGDASE
jgi:uncharacterized protein